jgi:hypothetical protein
MGQEAEWPGCIYHYTIPSQSIYSGRFKIFPQFNSTRKLPIKNLQAMGQEA